MIIKCKICKIKFEVYPCRLKHGCKYYSVKCRNIGLSENRLGKKNPAWIGDKVGYKGVHVWMARNFIKPLRCENCGKIRKLDWANINGKYKRDRADWKALCRKCHMTEDGRMNKRNVKGKFCGEEWNPDENELLKD